MPRAESIFIAALTCLPAVLACAAPITEDVTPLTSPEAFQIMTPAESEEHRAKMAELTGEARERYRNEQYRKLRERAQAQGYELPETPPWGRTELLPPPMPPAPSERHAAEASRQPSDTPRGKPTLHTDSSTALSNPPLAEPSRSRESRLAHREAFGQLTDNKLVARSKPLAGHPSKAGTAATEQMRQSEVARRQAIQARIDQAIEALGQAPDDWGTRPPINYPPAHGPCCPYWPRHRWTPNY